MMRVLWIVGRRCSKRCDEYVDDRYEKHSEDYVVIESVGLLNGWGWAVVDYDTCATATAVGVQAAFEYEHNSYKHL